MLEARIIGVSVARPWRDLYEAIWRPETFPRWASGLSRSALTRDGDAWRAEGPEGEVRIRFTDHNALGVMDHTVLLPDGSEVHVPLRVVADGAGAEVLLTLFRQLGMSDERFEADAAWIRRDLAALKALAEA